jgi:N-carbamoylputrescine amidase
MAGTPSTVSIGLVQMSCAEDPVQNLEKALARTEEATRRGARIVCLPELFRSRYFCQSEDVARFALAEPIPGPSTERLGKLAAAREITIVASLFEKRAEGLYHNTAVTIGPDGRISGLYRKMHIPDDPLYYEKFYFTPGDLGFPSVAAREAQIATLVCWDQWFPEAARSRAPRSSSIRRRSAGSSTSRPRWTPRSTMPGRRSSARMRSRTESSWRW